MPKCIELLSCDWLISNLFYRAIEQVYLIKVAGECITLVAFERWLGLVVSVCSKPLALFGYRQLFFSQFYMSNQRRSSAMRTTIDYSA